ncbi:ThiF family adenylyltransferase [Desulfosediminicola ganghwensis]|uniref:ThiF family adenylyltransferase n=1 Tax=Desulfosediminicola ganghwensis TaxID=2569540 RepID=UPI0010AD44DF|nr:ThiF family adenylyltransferase [Desulfosediminicola ganghwensis]
MSTKLIDLNSDLRKLVDEGYEVEVKECFLILHSVPYVNSKSEITYGALVTDLTLNNDRTTRPGNHQVWFVGEHPCKKDGSIISAIRHTTATQTLCDGLVVHHRFSCKPPVGYYEDYFEKMTRYEEIISAQARAIDATVTARTFKPVLASEEDSVFCYRDSASSRVGIGGLAKKLAVERVALVGLGGSGSYVLDLVAKTHVREIHLFDGDDFLQHNAFRAPGAASISCLKRKLLKVEYFSEMYKEMRRGIVPHPYYIDDGNVDDLSDFDFVFLCVDKPVVRKLVSDFLNGCSIPFIDVGMELELVEEQLCIVGTGRVTMSTPEKSAHFADHVSLHGDDADDLYGSNIQVADMNSLIASMAVVKWKKYCGYYQDNYQEHQSAYVINTHQLTRDEMLGV